MSLKRLQSRRVPKTRKYKHNLQEERHRLQQATQSVMTSVERLQRAVLREDDIHQILHIVLAQIIDKNVDDIGVDEQTKGHLVEFMWQICIPLHMIESCSLPPSSDLEMSPTTIFIN